MAEIKHIVIINQYIGSPYHGMEYRHYYLAKNLIAEGYVVTLISGSYSHLFSKPPQIKSNYTKETIDGINYIWIKVPKYHSSKSIGRIWNMIYFAWRLYFLKDIPKSHIVVSSPSLFPVKFATRLAKKFNTKFFFEVRDIWPLTLVELSSISARHPFIKLMKYYEKFAYKYADKVISLLPAAKEYYCAQGMDEDKFVYIPNGIEVQDQKKDTLLSQQILTQIKKDKFLVVYAGTIGIANNLDYLIDAAEMLKKNKKIEFIILGDGGEKVRLQNRVQELGLDNVAFIGAIKKEEVNIFLKHIDVAFISLLSENIFRYGVSPNKVFEYMYAKRPIIWAIEAGNNLVEEAKCGKSVSLGNVLELTESILELERMTPEERRGLGQNGYTFVKRYHSYKSLALKLKKTIKE